MAENTSIEWTDHTFNPWIGCTKVSPGCAHCYAETLMATGYGRVKWGAGQPRVRTSAANWKQPLRWNERLHAPNWPLSQKGPRAQDFEPMPFICRKCSTRFFCASGGTPECEWQCEIVEYRPKVFCASLADVLDDEVPTLWRIDLFRLIHVTRNLDWLLLTKRPENFHRLLQEMLDVMSKNGAPDEEDDLWNWLVAWQEGHPPDNVWIGTTVEDQTRADERIPELLKIPARVRFLSCEPLLGPVVLPTCSGDSACPFNGIDGHSDHPFGGIDWVIAGGESGPGARPMHPEWARSLRDQCAAAGVPFLFKQWGEWAPHDGGDAPAYIGTGHIGKIKDPSDDFQDSPMQRVGKKAAGRLLDGIEHNGFPSQDAPHAKAQRDAKETLKGAA